MPANLTQILNFKANFHQEFELFSKKNNYAIYANNGGQHNSNDNDNDNDKCFMKHKCIQ